MDLDTPEDYDCLLGMPLDNLFSIGQNDGALNISEVRREGCRVHGMNIQHAQQAPVA